VVAWVNAAFPGRHLVEIFSGVILVLFWVSSVGMYCEWSATAWMGKMMGDESGRDWMINSGIFNFDWRNLTVGSHILFGTLFAAYPLCLYTDLRIGYSVFGRRKD
jgi:hypothetical protein